MSKSNKNLKEDAIVCAVFIAIFLGMGSLVGYDIHSKNVFHNRVESHERWDPKCNRWLTDKMADNVEALQDSTLSADFNHYRGLSRYFTSALVNYNAKKKSYDFAATAETDFPRQCVDVEQAHRFGGIHFMQNGEILDSLDNCVKKLDMRYDYLMKQRKSNQR